MFRKRKKEPKLKLPRYQDFSVQTTFDRIIFEDLVTDEDAYIVELARELLDGSPLLLILNNSVLMEANKVVAFLSGVIYACDGQVEKINSRVFLFARNQEFKDGTLKKFVEEYQE